MTNEITALLARVPIPGTFAVRRSSSAEDLEITVKGVGRIELPVPRAQALELCARARPARYGLKDRTLLDESVRDTWEIPKERLAIGPRWKKALDRELGEIARELGLPEGSRLEAELHNLLVYEPGQFFAAHQDSEKSDGMIGSLVVTLPSRFTGGALVVHHHDEKVTFADRGEDLALTAFYADCHHEVLPVTAGFRIVLTYNLILAERAVPAVGAGESKEIELLARGIRGHFEAHDRLVYLLDHQYTESGLAWSALKNGDAVRAARLREVARRLDSEIFLALADVHESWQCEDEHWSRGRRWGDRRYEARAEERASTPELIDLIETQIELRHWIGPAGEPAETISSPVAEEDVCYTKASVDLEPFKSEHEGYMGNYGNTVDRWYHRAAVVMWPRERTFVIRAKASPLWAVNVLRAKLELGDLEAARQSTERLLPFWEEVASRDRRRVFFRRSLRVASALRSDRLAAALLAPFHLHRLDPKSAPLLARLDRRYGLDWSRAIFAQWNQSHYAREDWVAELPSFIGPLATASTGRSLELARFIVSEQFGWLKESHERSRKSWHPKSARKELRELNPAILGLLESCLIADSPELKEALLSFIAEHHPLAFQTELLKAAFELYPPEALPELGLGTLHRRSTRALSANLAAPERSPDDWSIAPPSDCACELCKALAGFLRASDRIRFDWPLAQQKRQHIHQAIDRFELPVSHETLRRGSPYTLVLVKTRALFDSEAKARRAWRRDLAWLEEKRAAFDPDRRGAVSAR
jgi:hypothetical protein